MLDAGGNVAISPSGKRVAVLNDGTIQVFELPAPPPLPDASEKQAGALNFDQNAGWKMANSRSSANSGCLPSLRAQDRQGNQQDRAGASHKGRPSGGERDRLG